MESVVKVQSFRTQVISGITFAAEKTWDFSKQHFTPFQTKVECLVTGALYV